MGNKFRLIVIGLIGIIAFWLNDMINSIVMSFLGGAGSLDPILAFIIGVVIFLLELMTIGWIILKVPSVAKHFGG